VSSCPGSFASGKRDPRCTLSKRPLKFVSLNAESSDGMPELRIRFHSFECSCLANLSCILTIGVPFLKLSWKLNSIKFWTDGHIRRFE